MAKEVEKRKMKEYMSAMNERRSSEHDYVEEESVSIVLDTHVRRQH
jgi:hypothetical protein